MFRILVAVVVMFVISGGHASALVQTTLTAQEETFIDDLWFEMELMLEASDELVNLLNEASSDPTIVLNRSWLRSAERTVGQFDELAQSALLLDPSPRQQHLYIYWIEITSLLKASGDSFMIGFEDFDAVAIEYGSELIATATEVVGELTEVIEVFSENPAHLDRQVSRITSPAESCRDFTSYDVAQIYFAEHPEERRVLDRDRDGRACNREFDRPDW